VVGTDSESLDGVTLVCQQPTGHEADDLDVLDCCAADLVLRLVPSSEYRNEEMARRLAAALTKIGVDGLEVCD
jgi:hypothetical protein